MNSSLSEQRESRSAEFWSGVKDTFPLVVGAIPFGMIYGITAVSSGISALGTAAMSAFVFAGASQFIATDLVGSGASVAVIVLTTLVVNLRHALYATTLGPHVKHLSQRWLLPLGFWLTDETFVVAANRYNQRDNSPNKHWYYLGSAIFMYTNWQVVTNIGIIAGRSIQDPARWGLDFAMVVTFIGMLTPLVKDRPTLLAVVAAGGTALLANGLPNRLGLLLAALVGIIAGVMAERRLADREENTA